jgi:hypothetical protein
MDWFCSSIYLTILIIIIYMICKRKKEHFTIFYHDLKQDIFENVKQLYSVKVDRIDKEIAEFDREITNKRIEYNNDFCSKYSKFFKIDKTNAIVDKGKTFIPADVIISGTGTFSKERNKCIYSDKTYNSAFDCGEKIKCTDGLTISGQKVFKDSREMCMYDCV